MLVYSAHLSCSSLSNSYKRQLYSMLVPVGPPPPHPYHFYLPVACPLIITVFVCYNMFWHGEPSWLQKVVPYREFFFFSNMKMSTALVTVQQLVGAVCCVIRSAVLMGDLQGWALQSKECHQSSCSNACNGGGVVDPTFGLCFKLYSLQFVCW